MDEVAELGKGLERHVQFHLRSNDTITVICGARTKFYAGFFDREEYTSKVNADGPGMFRFEFGSDTKGFTTKSRVESEDDYFLVLRNGVFSPRAQISVQVSVSRVEVVEPTIRSS